MPQTKPFQIGYGILLAFLIIFVGTKISFIFTAVGRTGTNTFFPVPALPVYYITCSDP